MSVNHPSRRFTVIVAEEERSRGRGGGSSSQRWREFRSMGSMGGTAAIQTATESGGTGVGVTVAKQRKVCTATKSDHRLVECSL